VNTLFLVLLASVSPSAPDARERPEPCLYADSATGRDFQPLWVTAPECGVARAPLLPAEPGYKEQTSPWQGAKENSQQLSTAGVTPAIRAAYSLLAHHKTSRPAAPPARALCRLQI
jgi:hypothetical protein